MFTLERYNYIGVNVNVEFQNGIKDVFIYDSHAFLMHYVYEHDLTQNMPENGKKSSSSYRFFAHCKFLCVLCARLCVLFLAELYVSNVFLSVVGETPNMLEES